MRSASSARPNSDCDRLQGRHDVLAVGCDGKSKRVATVQSQSNEGAKTTAEQFGQVFFAERVNAPRIESRKAPRPVGLLLAPLCRAHRRLSLQGACPAMIGRDAPPL